MFHLGRERRFWELSTQILGQKCRQKLVILSFLGSRRDRVGLSQTIVPRSVLPIFKKKKADFQVLPKRRDSFVRFLASPPRRAPLGLDYILIVV